jgi:hypothetical protein
MADPALEAALSAAGPRLTLAPDRTVSVVFPEPLLPSPPPGRIAVLLDGEMAGLVALTPAPAGGAGARFRLPGHRLASFLALHDPLTGAPLLPTPLPLAGYYRLSWRRLAREGRVIAGAFRLAPLLDPVLHLAFSAGGAVIAEGFAAAEGEGRYAFRLSITRLPPPGPPQPLTLRLAGAALPVPFGGMALGAEALGLAGRLESAGEEGARGWALDLAAPDRPLLVELRRDGVPLGRVRAEQPRPDLAALGVSGTGGGFVFPFPLPPPPLGTAPVRIEAVLPEAGLALDGSPLILTPGAGVIGHFDALEEGVASGWALDRSAPHQPLAVIITSGGTVVAEGRADLFRPDVAEAGFGAGRAGFRITLPLARALREAGEISAHPALAPELSLPGSPRGEAPNPLRAAFEAHLAAPPAPALRQRLARRLDRQTEGIHLSLILPLRDPRPDWLEETLAALACQPSAAFEVIVADDGSRDPAVAEILARAAAALPLRHLRRPAPEGLAGALAAGLAAAAGSHLAVLEHDDVLVWDAVPQLRAALRASGADLLLADGLLFAASATRPEALAPAYGASLESLIEAALSGDLLTPLPFVLESSLARAAAPALGHAPEGAELLALLAAARARARRPVLLARPLYAHRRHHLGRRLGLGARLGEAHAALAANLARAQGSPLRPRRQGPPWWEGPPPKGPVRLAFLPGGEGAAEAPAFAARLGAAVHPAPLPADPAEWEAALAGPEPFVLFLGREAAAEGEEGGLAGLFAAVGGPGVAAAAPLLAAPGGRVAAAGLAIAAGAWVPALAGDEVWLGEGVRNPGPFGLLRISREAAGLPGTALLFRRSALAEALRRHPPPALAARLGGAAPALLPAAWALACRDAGGRLLATPHLLTLTALPPELSRAGLAPLEGLFGPLLARGDPFYRPYLDPEGRFALGREALSCRTPLLIPLSPGLRAGAEEDRPAPPARRGRRRGAGG